MSEARFDLMLTLFVLCQDYHSGQWSRGYRILSRIYSRYKNPSVSDMGYDEIRKSSLYNELATKYGDKL
jgi:hypothetical protein